MGLTISSAPAAEPITAAEAKTHLRVSHSSDDLYITALRKAARHQAEAFLNRSIITQTWVYSLDDFPMGGIIEIPRPTLQSVSSITYKDGNGTSQTLPTTVYGVKTSDFPGFVYLKDGQSWPPVYNEPLNVEITFISGFGDEATIPFDIKQALLVMVADMYDQRQSEIPIQMNEIVTSARYLLWPHRMVFV